MKALSYLIIIFLTPTIILLNFRLLVGSHNYYQKEFAKLKVYHQIEKNTANMQSKSLIDYLLGDGQIDKEFFTKREVLHLADVKNLINQAQILLIINFGLIAAISSTLLIKKKKKILSAALSAGSATGIGAILALAVSSAVNFNFLFTNFHFISFHNDLWLLPPESNLIKLFPQEFFRDAANRIALQSLLMLLGTYIFAKYLLKKK